MSYRVTNKHIESALDFINGLIGKEDGEVGCIRTYNNQVVQLVNKSGGIRTLSSTVTKRQAYDTLQAMINFHLFTTKKEAVA